MMEKKFKDAIRSYSGAEDILFLMAFAIFLSLGIFEMAMIDLPSIFIKGLRYIAYIMLAIKIVLSRYEKLQLFTCVVFGAVSLVSYSQCRDFVIVVYMLLCLAAIGVDENKFLKVSFVLQAVITLVVFFLSQCNVLLDYINKYVLFDRIRVRHFLGFTYSTTAPMLLFFAICTYILIRRGRLITVEYVICMILSIAMYRLTDSRFIFYIAMLLINIAFFGQYFISKGTITFNLKILIYAFPWLCAFITIWAQCVYKSGSEVWKKLDELVNTRLGLGHSAIETYGFSLFGQEIEWIGNSYGKMASKGYNYVDCSYLQIALQFGILMLVLILCAYSYILYKAIKSGKYYVVYVFVPILILSMTEPRLYNLTFNPLVLLAFTNGLDNVHKF